MNEFRMVIPGDAVAQARPKLASIGGHARAFKPARSRRYEDIVRQIAVREYAGRPIIANTSIAMITHFYRAIPASWSKVNRMRAEHGELRPTGRPDLSNLLKAIEDGLNGVVYIDDALIVESYSCKRYGDPRVEVTLEWADPPAVTASPRRQRDLVSPNRELLPEAEAPPF